MTGGLFLCAQPFVASLVRDRNGLWRGLVLTTRAKRGPCEECFAMAEERDDEQFGENQGSNSDQQTTGQQSQPNELGQQQGQQSGSSGSQQLMSNQGSEDSFDDQSIGGQSGGGRPIGGNDSNSGSGTTASQGADF